MSLRQAGHTAAHTRPGGYPGRLEYGGLDLDQAAAFCALAPDQVTEHPELLLATDWLTDIEVDAGHGRLRGQLTERVLPLSGLL
ncbi:hypothetical protein [Streptomyces sp. G45]|uniref:hypothetical protein n=1 Tax=Streptomyces sp. G45 TaxID=3406627 RepID=UPI003C1B43BE